MAGGRDGLNCASLASCIEIEKKNQLEEYHDLEEFCIKSGPWGGGSATSGMPWSYLAKGGFKQITIHHTGAVITSISFQNVDVNGKVTCSSKFGDDCGQAYKIDLDWPREFLTSISGSFAHVMGCDVIRSLCFNTNLSKYGPYGLAGGETFSFPMKNAVIVGFHGRSDSYLNSIGVYVKPRSILGSSAREESSGNKEIKMVKMVGQDGPGPGPWGGSNGKVWDIGIYYGSIKELVVYVGEGIVHAIAIHYKKRNGEYVWSQRHGGPGGDKCTIMPDDDEHIERISGYYGKMEENGGLEAVKSITVYTNKRTYGPFGDEVGTFFFSPLSTGRVVGFHGRSGTYLDAIGVHFDYF